MEREKQDRVFFLVIAIAALGAAMLFGISFWLVDQYQKDRAVHEAWCPRTTYGVYDAQHENASVENKTAPLFVEFKTPAEVKRFCELVFTR